MKHKHILIGDDGDDEILCDHGVGHSYGMHTCDGCCWRADFNLKLREAFGEPEAPGDKMQEAFDATPEELSKAAVKAARREPNEG